jgi:hypothetical protein
MFIAAAQFFVTILPPSLVFLSIGELKAYSTLFVILRRQILDFNRGGWVASWAPLP